MPEAAYPTAALQTNRAAARPARHPRPRSNPDDTLQVFEDRGAVGNAGERRSSASAPGAGQPDPEREPQPAATLDDRENLKPCRRAARRIYADFTEGGQFTGLGLADASIGGRRAELAPERALLFARLRDMHDLWHVTTGYGRDLVGEAALLAFSYAQTRNRGVGFIVAVAWLRASGEAAFARPVIVDGYRRGKRAQWLPGEDWNGC
jgi:ubiquinone biosynthesis protein COQ4